jgi:poly(3-hydroxybutyrate) depolymerase
VAAAGRAAGLPEGKSSFVFHDVAGDPAKAITVYTYVPRGIDTTTAKIVFVMHGHGKDADGYRDTWIPEADRYGFVVVAPLFDAAQWPHGGYSYASIVGPDGAIADRALWSFSVIEHLFDAVKTMIANDTPRYFIYGHSEGAQFVHRLVLLLPEARYARAVAANAGWYTMPTATVRYPFGTMDSPITDATLATSFGRELTVLLGDRDIDPNHKELNRTPPAMAEGSNRFERGHRFFDSAEMHARALNVPFAWRLQVVPGAAHQNSRMSPPAAAVLMAP